MRGDVELGQHLPEQELAEQMHVSCIPVREAMRQLEQEGLVVRVPNRGCFVADFTEFFRVVLPISLPGIVAVSIFAFLAAWNDFLWSILLFRFDRPMNNMIAAISQYAGWGFFDYRMKGEEGDFDQGYQSVPVNWRISSPRKRGFFKLLQEITGGK